MCFGGGQSTNNVRRPSYSLEDSHTAVVQEDIPADKATTDGEGMRATTLADPQTRTAAGLNLKGM